MLILARKVGEEILLGNDIVLKITEITKNGVKVGIQAPKETLILRGELKEEIEKSNQKATKESSLESLQNLSELLKK